MFKLLYKLFQFAPRKILCLTFLTAVTSLLEGLGVALVVPVIGFMLGQGSSSALSSTNLASHNLLTETLHKIVDFFGADYTMLTLLIGMVCVFFVKALISIIGKALIARITTDFSYNFQKQLIDDLLGSRYLSLQNKNLGELVSSIIHDPQASAYALNLCNTALSNVILMLIYVGMLFFISIPFTLIVVCVSLLLVFPLKKINKKAGDLGKRKTFDIEKLTGQMIQITSKLKFYLTSSKLQSHLTELRPTLEHLRHTTFYTNFASNMYAVIAQPFSIVLIVFILLASKHYAISFDLLILFILSFMRIPPLLFQIQSNSVEIQSYFPSFQKILNLIDYFKTHKQINGTILLPEAPAYSFKLQAKNLVYKIDQKTILNIPDLLLRSQRLYFITGESGSGKTTFIDILTGLKPEYTGNIEFHFNDSSTGYELQRLERDSWKNQFAYVSQDPVLWNATIKENILEYSEDSDQKFKEVLNHFGCTEFVSQAKDHENTLLSDTALNISGGQRQRLSIARAFYSQKPIVFLDEVTSALDHETEENILQSIRTYQAKYQQTIFIITHKQQHILPDDNVLHFSKGNLVFFGSYKDSIHKKFHLKPFRETLKDPYVGKKIKSRRWLLHQKGFHQFGLLKNRRH